MSGGMVEEREGLLAEIDRLNEALREANLTIEAEQERVERMRNVGSRLAYIAADQIISSPMSVETLRASTVLVKIALNIEQASRGDVLDPEPGDYL